jgi:hypothetical protein
LWQLSFRKRPQVATIANAFAAMVDDDGTVPEH